MGTNLIYLDHAATSFPKPEKVYVAHDTYLRNAGNPGRGAHELALSSARLIFDARSAVANFLGAENAERLIFTPGCTYSINMVLRGLGLHEGDCVVTSALEHNALMRPLRNLEELAGIRVVVLPYAQENIFSLDDLRKTIRSEQPKLCAFSEASNVTGERISIEAVSEICHENNTPLLIDAAQTAGSESDCLRHPGITFWAAPGHKGLMGAPGVGLLYVREAHELSSFIQGGTGSGSESFAMPQQFPDQLEAGTLPGSAIAALGAGVEFVHKTGASSIDEHQSSLASQFRQWCQSKDWIRIYGRSFESGYAPHKTAPIVSFSLTNMRADRVADILDTEYKIAVRPGLHCAAQAHATLSTSATGLVRVSFGYTNTMAELKELCDSLSRLNNG